MDWGLQEVECGSEVWDGVGAGHWLEEVKKR
jgi:hypothetical protein